MAWLKCQTTMQAIKPIDLLIKPIYASNYSMIGHMVVLSHHKHAQTHYVRACAHACMCVCMCVCVQACVHACVNVRARVRACVHSCVCVTVCTNIATC